jgi:hypothetical protein
MNALADAPSTLVFIVIDSVTTVIQIVGAALIGVAESKDSRGEETKITSDQANNILLAGLALQVSISFGMIASLQSFGSPLILAFLSARLSSYSSPS